MAQINRLSNRSSQLTIDPGASGDSYVQFDISTTNKFRVGVDDDASDAFKVAIGNALGSSDALVISAAGEVNKPLTSAFLGYIGSDDSNRTGDGTLYTIGTNVAFTEVFDQNSDFNTNGTFTAPVTGRYYLSCAVRLATPSGGGTYGEVSLVTSNRTYTSQMFPLQDRVAGFVDGSTSISFNFAVTADMDASDTCTFAVLAGGGSATCDILGSATVITYFCGYLAA